MLDLPVVPVRLVRFLPILHSGSVLSLHNVSPATNTQDEVHNNCDVNSQDDHFDCGEVPGDLVNLQRNQPCGRDDGEVFGPRLSEQQTRSLGQEQTRVDKRSYAQRFELIRADLKDAAQERMHKSVVRINTEDVNPMRDGLRHIPMQKFDRPNCHGDQ